MNALVNYESSDDELQDVNDSEEVCPTLTPKATKSRVESTEEPIKETNLFSTLPAPKTSHSSLAVNSLNDIIVNKKPGLGPIKISVPSLKHYSEDNDSDEELKKSKRLKRSSAGTGLSALLPKPKNTVTNKSLMPQSVIRSKANIPSPKTLNTSFAKPSVQSTEDNSQQKNNFFFIDDETDDNLNKNINNELFSYDSEYGPKPESIEAKHDFISPKEVYEQNANYMASNTSSATSSTNKIPSLDDITYKKLIASKFGEESAQDINIIDVDVSKHLSQSQDWLKTISEEKEEPYNGVAPTSTARRKHQITFLAFQAKQREVELKNQWAQNRLTKSQTRSKYGF